MAGSFHKMTYAWVLVGYNTECITDLVYRIIWDDKSRSAQPCNLPVNYCVWILAAQCIYTACSKF